MLHTLSSQKYGNMLQSLCKASLVALNRQSILGLIFTTLLRDLARFNVINWWANDSGVI